MGLAHSVVLAKHIGVEKLSGIRQYYDHFRVPGGSVNERAFKLQAADAVPHTGGC